MSRQTLMEYLATETKGLEQAGLLRREVEHAAPPGPVVRVGERDRVSFLSSDYLGLAGHAEVKRAAMAAIDAWGVGVASSRAVSGTLTLHRDLERAVAALLGTEDALVVPSGHHATTGLFEALLGDRDYVFCDEMVRPSVADGIRLSRARAYAYRNDDMEHLEERLRRSRGARFRVIATDGVFPVTGRVADLEAIYKLAARYHAFVVVDDSHGVGVLGRKGEGTFGHVDVGRSVDAVVGSFGAALGGGAGGFIAGATTLVAWLRQRARPHLASTALSPAAAAAALAAIGVLGTEPALRARLEENKRAFKDSMSVEAGLIIDGTHPAVSVLIRDAVQAQRLTNLLFRQGFHVAGYCHPVVAEGDARVCLKVTARHERGHLEGLAKAIGAGMRELKIQL